MRRGFRQKFTKGGWEAAKKYHLCTSCRYSQTGNWENAPCPSCGRSGTRQFFPSRAEMQRGATLLLLQEQGKISNLKFQCRFNLHVNSRKVGVYVCDAVYLKDEKTIYEDSKSPKYIDDLARLKIALFEVIYGVEVLIPQH